MNMSVATNTKLEKLFAGAPSRLYAPGNTIVCAGRDPDGVMLIDSGIVEQYDVTAAGNKVVVNRFRPGAFFPMSWALNRTPNEYFFGAADSVTVRYVPAEKVVRFLRQNPDMALDLLSRVFRGTDGMLRRLIVASSAGAAERVSFELLNEAYRFGAAVADSSDRLITIRQQDIAERSGLARETVSRELRKLKKAGLVRDANNGFFVSIRQLETSLA